MQELTISLMVLPQPCRKCAALYLLEYCGIAFPTQFATALLSLESRSLTVPEGCLNDLGGLTAEGIRNKLLISRQLK